MLILALPGIQIPTVDDKSCQNLPGPLVQIQIKLCRLIDKNLFSRNYKCSPLSKTSIKVLLKIFIFRSTVVSRWSTEGQIKMSMYQMA